eukprot:4955673-Amphidinium_carterae.1
MDQPAPMWSLPNDNPAQNLQPSSQSATTTILTQPQQPPNITLYDQKYAVRAVTGTTLVVDKDNTTTDQLRRWAILIDTGAITSAASREHFSHIPIKALTTSRSTSSYSSYGREHRDLRDQRSDVST